MRSAECSRRLQKERCHGHLPFSCNERLMRVSSPSFSKVFFAEKVGPVTRMALTVMSPYSQGPCDTPNPNTIKPKQLSSTPKSLNPKPPQNSKALKSCPDLSAAGIDFGCSPHPPAKPFPALGDHRPALLGFIAGLIIQGL